MAERKARLSAISEDWIEPISKRKFIENGPKLFISVARMLKDSPTRDAHAICVCKEYVLYIKCILVFPYFIYFIHYYYWSTFTSVCRFCKYIKIYIKNKKIAFLEIII